MPSTMKSIVMPHTYVQLSLQSTLITWPLFTETQEQKAPSVALLWKYSLAVLPSV